ncbi:MAG: FAD-binding oxidoreductase, partial [archaeon]|nr:FAD-binding oxidoreductase [archaeon]
MIKESLQKILKDKDQIVDDPEILKEFSEDHSFVPSKIPVLVVKPKTRPEVQQVIQLANEEGFHLIPVSSGNPRLHGDTVPVKDNTVILDLRKLNKIHWVERKNRVCVIEPGVTFTQLEKEVEKKGLRLLMPLCPKASKSVIVASLEREPKTLTKYEWDVCDPLASTEIMLGNGEILWAGEVGMCGNDEKWQREHGFSHKVPFGVATVNIKKMAGGAQGTIGICTWSSVRLELLPEFEDIYMVGSENVAELADFAHQLVYDRTADDIFILNSLNLASMVKKEPADIISLSKTLPPWVLIYTVSGFGTLPKNMFEYKKNLIEERNIPMTDSVSGLTSKDIIHLIRKPSDEPYWKLRLKGDTRDLFFQTSLKKTASFIKSMKKLTAEA